MRHLFTMLMLLCFGLSWPISVYKTLKAKNADGKSCTFGLVIIFGYLCGIAGEVYQIWTKTVTEPILFGITFGVYILNLCIVIFDTLITAYYKHWNKRKTTK